MGTKKIMGSAEVILQHMQEKEERDKANAKKIKEYEDIIKHEEENIKNLQVLKNKLSIDLKRKMQEISKNEVTHEILLQKKDIWSDILIKTQDDLKKEEEKLDALQQSVCLNRIEFCENIRECINESKIIDGPITFTRESTLITTEIKREAETDEYRYLINKIKNLEDDLNNLKDEEARIEETKRFKLQLQAEPSSGEQFHRLRIAIKDIKNELKKLDTEIITTKTVIGQSELKCLNKNNPKNIIKPLEEPDMKQITTSINNSMNNELSTITPKLVKFKETVEVQNIPTLPPLNSILKSTNFTANIPSPSLRRQLCQKRISKLDEEMKEILFKKTA